MPELSCQSCGARVTYDEPVPRDSQCESCGTDLRCCRNCRHWDARYNNECTETQADPVQDKTRRNFCEFFYFTRAAFAGKPGGTLDRAAEARAKLDALFGGRPAPGAAPSIEGGVSRGTLAGGSVAGETPGPAAAGAGSPTPAEREAARKAEARANLERLFGKSDEGDGR